MKEELPEACNCRADYEKLAQPKGFILAGKVALFVALVAGLTSIIVKVNS